MNIEMGGVTYEVGAGVNDKLITSVQGKTVYGATLEELKAGIRRAAKVANGNAAVPCVLFDRAGDVASISTDRFRRVLYRGPNRASGREHLFTDIVTRRKFSADPSSTDILPASVTDEQLERLNLLDREARVAATEAERRRRMIDAYLEAAGHRQRRGVRYGDNGKPDYNIFTLKREWEAAAAGEPATA